MCRNLNAFYFLILSVLLTPCLGQPLVPDLPVTNFVLYRFDEDTGFIAWELKGVAAEYLSENKIRVDDMELKVFVGEGKKSTTLHSKRAFMHPKSYEATGDSGVFVEGDGFTIEGDHWFWSRDDQRIQIKQNAKVKFQSEMKYLIK